MRVLAITKIFPNATAPQSSPFNRQQFEALGRLCELEVMATLPWLPGRGVFAKLTGAATVPANDVIGGLLVRHPRTMYIPKIPAASGLLYLASIAPTLALYRGKIDCVLGSWAYPDGCAAVAAANILGVPAVVKVHGSDLNVVANMPGPRAVMRAMLPRAKALVVVSSELGRSAVHLGVDKSRIHLVRNGVDASLFYTRDRALARRRLDLPQGRRMILFVGNLKRAKGVDELARAFETIAGDRPDVDLVVVGEGLDRDALERTAGRFDGRVNLVGRQPLEAIPEWVAASDIVTLPSWMEGTPNVVLEALACGRRVVATAVGGVPELLHSTSLGALIPPRDSPALADALGAALDTEYDPSVVAQMASAGSWQDSAAHLCRVLSGVV